MTSPTATAHQRDGRSLRNGIVVLGVVIVVTAVSHGCASRGGPEAAPEKPGVANTAPDGPLWLTQVNEPSFVELRDPARRISIEYPENEWLNVPGGLTTIATFTQEDGLATVVLEQTELNQALAPNEVTEVFGEIEAETIRERSPEASDFDTRLLDHKGRRVVAIQYQRQGSHGPEAVRQYSFPIAKRLYRLTCVIQPDRLADYEPICAHMAASFTVLEPGT